jgi:cis-3-alkyl-4-acyloxetan-2-one decarboxylase
MRLTPIIDGNENAETIVFLQGWPDDVSLWDEAVEALKDRYRCVRVNMPNYDGTIDSRWGYTTDEIVDALVELVRAQRRPVTLVLHDWGAYWGHAVHHRCPDAVSRLCSIDVAPHFKPNAKEIAAIVAYQSWLYGAFVVGGSIGNWMTRRFAKLGGAPMPQEKIDARMNYPYRNVWADLFSGRAGRMTKGYWPKKIPLLFLYGKRKPWHFHSQQWLEHVKNVGGEVVAVPSGHWVPRHPTFVPTLERWLEATSERRATV